MLRNKTITATLILMITLLFGMTFQAHAEEYNGYFDDFEGDTIVGWGWDPSLPNTAVPVSITIRNEDTSELVKEFHPTAVTYRDDLCEKGIGNGRHGFRIRMDWDSLPDGTYVVEGWINDQAFGNSKTWQKGEAASRKETAEEPAVQASGLRSLGVFRTTAYCPCSQCSEGWGRHTCTGAIARSNHTIAVDPRIIPYGSKVMINGVVYTAEDRGGGVKGNHIDIFFDNHAQTRQHGTQNVEVFLLS